MKRITIALLLALAANARATMVVVDPALITKTTIDQIQNIAVWTKTQLAAVQTQLNSFNQLQEQILQAERLGDPHALVAGIPGVSTVTNLAAIYQQGERDISDWSSYTNPQSWKMSADQIMGIYGQSGFTANGVRLGAAQSLVQFNVSNYNVSSSAQQSVSRLTAQLKTLTDQLSQATLAMQSSTDAAHVAKYHAAISSLDSQISSVRASLAAAELSEKLQVQQNENAQQIYRANVTQQSAVSFSQDLTNSVNQANQYAPNDLSVPQFPIN